MIALGDDWARWTIYDANQRGWGLFMLDVYDFVVTDITDHPFDVRFTAIRSATRRAPR
jgi:hypothetical protein